MSMVFQLPSNVTSVIMKLKHPKAYRPTKVLYTMVLHLAATFAILKEGHQNCWRGMLKICTKTLGFNVMNVAARQEARQALDITLKPGIGKSNILKVNVSWWPQRHTLIDILNKSYIKEWCTSDIVTTIFSFWFHHAKTNLEQPSLIHLIFSLL